MLACRLDNNEKIKILRKIGNLCGLFRFSDARVSVVGAYNPWCSLMSEDSLRGPEKNVAGNFWGAKRADVARSVFCVEPSVPSRAVCRSG